jgi:membrane associated rhomboid family serine protease
LRAATQGYFSRMTPWVKRLIIANVGVYFLQLTVQGVTQMLAFAPSFALTRPWTILTYMFAHSTSGVSHILFNMIALYFFGPRVEERLGSTQFIRLYLFSGIVGALLSIVFNQGGYIIGASGAVFGVQLAFAKYWPRERIYIWGILPVEAWLLVLITTAMALYGGFAGGGGGVAHFAHLGGYLGAWVYLLWWERRSPAKQWKTKLEKPAKKVEIGNYKSIDTKSIHEVNRAEVDRILDKISAKGVESLTPAERTFLSHFAPPDDRPVRPA